MQKIILLATILLSSFFLSAQKMVEITGEVYDEYLVPFSGAKIKDSRGIIATTNSDGVFKVSVTLPVELIGYADGFSNERVTITEAGQEVSFILKQASKLDEIVLSASKTPERVFESPVSIRRLSLQDTKKTPARNFYGALGYLPGVDIYNSSASLQVLNTRGFTIMKNFRFIQLVDGIDNVVPADSQVYGNLNGAIGLDVASAELLPGASSALYGSNAINGALLITTKNPFEYTGIAVKTTGGVFNQKNVGSKPFYELQTRLAYKFSQVFAASASVSFESGEEWHARDHRNSVNGILDNTTLNTSDRNKTDANYNGLNVYGDESFQSLKTFRYTSFLRNYDQLVGNSDYYFKLIKETTVDAVSRTGYKEQDLIGNRYHNKKFHANLYFRPWGDDRLNIIWRSRFNDADPFLFQGSSDRYELDNYLQHHALEFKGRDFMVRGYYSLTDLNARSLTSLAMGLDNYYYDKNPNKPSWYEVYSDEFRVTKSHELARKKADKNRLIPGTSLFQSEKARLNSLLLSDGGVNIEDHSEFYHFDAKIDLTKYFKVVSLLLGGSYRDYSLSSSGSLFADTPGNPVTLYEYGAYAQAKKSFLDNRWVVQGSLRYDGTSNYKGQYSPRISTSYTMGENRNHSLRFTYQTAFRNPAIQDQYYAIQLGNSFTFGNTEDNIRRLKGRKYLGKEVTDYLSKSGFTLESYNEFYQKAFLSLGQDSGLFDFIKPINEHKDVLKVFDFNKNQVKSENLRTIELGYRGLFNLADKVFELDFNVYHNQYSNFITNRSVLIPLSENSDVNAKNKLIESVSISEINKNKKYAFLSAVSDLAIGNVVYLTKPVNTNHDVYSYGGIFAVKTKMFRDLDVAFNYAFATFDDDRNNRSDFDTNRFNKPKHTFQFNLAHKEIFKNLGFNVNYKWQSQVVWDSPLVKGIIEPNNILDAQVSYSIPSMKSRFKLGANNILAKGYYPNLGVGEIGSTYFLSWTIND